jgi:quercetin dioxygenase-like cupin family protein
MRIDEASSGVWERGNPQRFSGEVWLRYTLFDDEGTNVGEVHFSAGARTHWHRHPKGQFLYVLSGRGRTRSRGETGRVLLPGDVVHVTEHEWHFHGGEPGSPMVHVAVNLGGRPEWGDPVPDDEYDEGF